MKPVFIVLFLIHGLIHLLGFIKAFGIAEIKLLSIPIPRIYGLFWIIAAILFLIAFIQYNTHFSLWWLTAFIAIGISQILVIYFWKDAWIGTIGNAIIIVVALASFGAWKMEKEFRSDVEQTITETSEKDSGIITEEDLIHLPEPVKKYMIYAGVIHNPKVKNFRIKFEGEMRDRNMDWFPFTSVQYNFYDDPTRLFFMKGKVNGLPVTGYHKYRKDYSGMLVNLLSLFPVADISGREMFEAETVTFLNDMCLFAPGALLDKRISWEPVSDTEAKVIYTNRGTTVSARLYFNQKTDMLWRI